MIILKCSKCQEQLEVDDGFAGGVCRCVHCGALSQVPLQTTVLDKKGRPTAPPPMAKPVIAAVEAELTIAPTRKSTLSEKRQGTLALILLVVALLLAAGIGLLAVKMFGKKDGDGDGGGGSGNGGGRGPVPTATTYQPPSTIENVKGPSIAGLAIPGKSVAYLLNVGSSMASVLDYAQVTIRESAKKLDKAEFCVLPWRVGERDAKEMPAFPKAGLASPAKVSELVDWFASASMSDARDPELAAQEAAKRGVETVVIVTRNDLDRADVDRLAKVKNVKWMAIAIAADSAKLSDYPQLVRLAGDEKSVSVVSESDLRSFLEHAGN